MRILMLSFFFKPDISPAAFRMNALLNQFKDICPKEYEVEVLTTFPNRYEKSYNDLPEIEYYGHIRVRRIKLPFSTKSKKDEVFNYTYYFFRVLSMVIFKKYDFVFATSSKVFTGVLGSIISILKRIPLYLDNRDLFVETLEGNSKSWVFKKIFVPLLKGMMQLQYSTAKRVNLVSKGFIPITSKTYNIKDVTFFTNGIDDVFIKYMNTAKNTDGLPDTGKRKRITYAGHIGLGYSLHTFIPFAAKALPEYDFVIIGDGFLKPKLVEKIEELGVKNVIFKSLMSREELCSEYSESDFLLMNTKKNPMYEIMISIKIFDYGSTNKPILAGAEGYPKQFMEENVPGTIFFEPSNWEEMVKQLKGFEYKTFNREEFRKEYAFSNIMNKMSRDILSLIDDKNSR